jgi:predicted unusual protein kinase regulating ubiquinone biosynthesis (AarF/ABC1/UbiB family)
MRGDWVASVHEFERVLAEEMDYRREAESAARFKRNFASWETIHVPPIHHEFTSERLLVMEFIEGIKVTDLDGLRAAGHSPRALNERLYRTYFKQLFEDGFFHADPHPGNLLVMADGRLAFFDFGMSGVVDDDLRGKLVAAFFHLLERDISGIIDDLFGLGFLPPGADVTGLHDVVAEAFARRLEVKLADVRFNELVYDLAPVVYEYPFTTPARFTFLIRALMTLEGISVVMNPDFNFFEVAGPYARDFLFRRGTASLRGQVLDSLRDARSGRFDWGRVWRLAKSAYSLYAGK